MNKTRCAIYTRKSTEEGLDQSFNSLDAQREACKAYIKSQTHEGWKLLADHYNDGGVSGGTIERPALKALLAEIDAGRVDMVVVYKVDRLTRSLADFAKLVERLDETGASFVSVTQQFNTSTSMGRLTLNVLLSFAQFEREVTAERIRDKIAASKKKGMWMGGLLPLGYDKTDDGLVINPQEAETVRTLFNAYLELGCVRKLRALADKEGLRSKARCSQDGAARPGRPLMRGALYHLLSNPIYIGKIRHKDDVYDGLHEPIIDEVLWEQVQARLAANRKARTSRTNAKSRSRLAGKLFDHNGEPLKPSHASKQGRRYRYYISKHLIEESGSGQEGWRIPAAEIERTICTAVREDREVQLIWAAAGAIDVSDEQLFDQVLRAQIRETHLEVAMAILPDQARLLVTAPYTLRRRGVETRLLLQTGTERDPDPVLARRILRAMNWVDLIKSGLLASEVANRESISSEYITHNLHFGFLSPQILEAVLSGRQPPHLSAKAITRMQRFPVDWAAQNELLLR